MRRKWRHRPEQHKTGDAIDDDFLVTEAEMTPGVIGCLGKDQHDEMVKKMADVQIDVRNGF